MNIMPVVVVMLLWIRLHDGNVFIIPEGDLQETMSKLEDIISELGVLFGLII